MGSPRSSIIAQDHWLKCPSPLPGCVENTPSFRKMKIEKPTYPKGESIRSPIEFRCMALTIMPNRRKLVWCDIGLPDGVAQQTFFTMRNFHFLTLSLGLSPNVGFFFGFAQQFQQKTKVLPTAAKRRRLWQKFKAPAAKAASLRQYFFSFIPKSIRKL